MCQKTSVFRFWCSMRFADFLFFSMWFSVFVKNISGFSVLVPKCGFWFFLFFSYLALFVYTVLYAVFGLGRFCLRFCGFGWIFLRFCGCFYTPMPPSPTRPVYSSKEMPHKVNVSLSKLCNAVHEEHKTKNKHAIGFSSRQTFLNNNWIL